MIMIDCCLNIKLLLPVYRITGNLEFQRKKSLIWQLLSLALVWFIKLVAQVMKTGITTFAPSFLSDNCTGSFLSCRRRLFVFLAGISMAGLLMWLKARSDSPRLRRESSDILLVPIEPTPVNEDFTANTTFCVNVNNVTDFTQTSEPITQLYTILI